MYSPHQMFELLDDVASAVEGFQYDPMPTHLIDGIALVAAAMEQYDAQSRDDFIQYLRDAADMIRQSESYCEMHEYYSYPQWHRITKSGTQVMEIGDPFHTAECKPVIVVCTYPDDLINNPAMAKQLREDNDDISLDQRLVRELTPLAMKLFGSHGRLFVKGGIHYISPLHFLLCPSGTERLKPKQVAEGFSALLTDPELEERYMGILEETKHMVAETRSKHVGLFSRLRAFFQRKR